ncbi:MAG: CARDB domain-containing protein, partial [Nitrososphaeria archaeon]
LNLSSAARLLLNVWTDRTCYARGELVKIYGTVAFENGTFVENATVAIEVKNPNNSTVFLDITYSLADGVFQDSFRLSSIAIVGHYTIYVSASKNEHVGLAFSVFYVTSDDLSIVDVTPIQVVWGASALVAGKHTLLKVDVLNSFEDDVITQVRITINGKVFEENLYLNHTHVTTFYLPSEGFIIIKKPGTCTISVEIDPHNTVAETNETNNVFPILNIDVKDTKRLRILYVPASVEDETPPSYYDVQKTASKSSDFILATYPIADDEFCFDIRPEPYKEKWRINAIITLNRMTYVLSSMAKISGFDRAVGILPENWFSDHGLSAYGYAFGNPWDRKARPGVLAENKFWTVAAHEIGHSYGLWFKFDFLNRKWIEEYDFYGLGRLSSGYWVNKRTPIPRENEGKAYCFMGSRNGLFEKESYSINWPEGKPDARWIDNDCYDQLLTAFTSEKDPKVILIRGEIYKNNTVKLDPWYSLSSGVPDLEVGGTGNYTILLLDNQSNTLAQYSFNVTFTSYATYPPIELDVVDFIFTVPYYDGTSCIQIRNETWHVLATRNVSTNAPQVIVNFPSGGETLLLNRNYTITWSGYDLDGDTLTYTVLISNDGGENWIPLAIDLFENHYILDTSFLPVSTSYLVKVVASDGVNCGEDVTDSFFTVGMHDIAIANISLSKQNPSVNETIFILVEVENRGDFTETFEVSVNYTRVFDPLIGTQTICLAPSETIIINFSWSPANSGRYEIKAYTNNMIEDLFPQNNILIIYLYVTPSYTASTSPDDIETSLRNTRFYYSSCTA